MAAPTLKTLSPDISRISGKPFARTWAKAQADLAGAPSFGGSGIFGRNPARADGFNYAYYASVRPDVIAAGIDPLTHWLRNGRFEGTAPYEGGPTEVDRADLIYRQGPPVVDMPDVYAPPGATEVRVRMRLLQDGKPDLRSFSIGGAGGTNDPAVGRLGFGDYGATTHDGLPFFPCTGSEKEFTVKIDHPDASGAFGFFAGHPMDFPRIEGRCAIHLNTTPPPGYTYPPKLPARARLTCPSADGGFSTDFLRSFDSDWEVGGGDLNGGRATFVRPGDRSTGGRLLDCYPVETINGKPTRVLRPVDCRNDPVIDEKGRPQPWAMPKLVDFTRASAYGTWQLDSTLPPAIDALNFSFWAITLGGWPPEWDHFEYRGFGAEANTHSPEDLQQRARLYKSIEGRHVVTVDRSRDWYRLWIDGDLAVENPNYLRDQAMGTTICIEGPGSSASGQYNPSDDLSKYPWLLHGFKQLIRAA